MIDAAGIEDLRLCHAAARVERCLASGVERRVNLEALQRALMQHADGIVRMIDDQEADHRTIARMAGVLQPFARVAGVLAPGHDPVLISIPSPATGGRTFVQLRPAHFRAAETVLQALS